MLEGNLRMSAQSRDLIRPNSAILVQQLSDCAGSTPWESRWLAHPDNSRQTGLLCVFALCVVQRVVCVRAHYNTSRGDRCARGPPLPPSASAWRSLGRLVGNVLGVCHIAVLGTWARRQVDAVTARRIFQSDTALSSSRSKAGR